MELIKSLLNKENILWEGFKIIYVGTNRSLDEIKENEEIRGDGFEISKLTFYNGETEYNLYIDEYGVLEDTTLQRVLDEIRRYTKSKEVK